MHARAYLSRLFDALRDAREAEYALLEGDPSDLAPLLSEAVEEALDHHDPDESDLRLRALIDLCAQVPGPAMADALLAILDHPDPQIRTEAGEAILDTDQVDDDPFLTERLRVAQASAEGTGVGVWGCAESVLLGTAPAPTTSPGATPTADPSPTPTG